MFLAVALQFFFGSCPWAAGLCGACWQMPAPSGNPKENIIRCYQIWQMWWPQKLFTHQKFALGLWPHGRRFHPAEIHISGLSSTAGHTIFNHRWYHLLVNVTILPNWFSKKYGPMTLSHNTPHQIVHLGGWVQFLLVNRPWIPGTPKCTFYKAIQEKIHDIETMVVSSLHENTWVLIWKIKFLQFLFIVHLWIFQKLNYNMFHTKSKSNFC